MTNVTLTTEQAQQIEEALEDIVRVFKFETGTPVEALAAIREARAEQATVSGGLCGGCAKKAADGRALYCVECWEKAEQPVSQEYQDHLVNQSFDWAAMATKHQFMEGYRIGLAEMREKCAVICEAKQSYSAMHANTEFAAVIRSINFEGDTGFRPVSEMIAEHKQDPKKAAAIEKAKMRKAEREPVAWTATRLWNRKDTWKCSADIEKDLLYAIPQPVQQEPVAFQMICPRCKVDRVTTPCPRGGVSDCPMTATAQNAAPVQQAEQEPVAVVEITYGREPECYVIGNIDDFPEGVFKLYASPVSIHSESETDSSSSSMRTTVRTKDLTDDEIMDLVRDECVDMRWPSTPLFIARAVIAADRELNR